MNATSERRWNQRGFVALCALFSGLALPISGFADHLAGPSPAADTRVGWSIVHTSLGVVFVIFCTWHVVLDRRALLKHLRDRALHQALPTRETLTAMTLIGGLLALTVTHAVAGR